MTPSPAKSLLLLTIVLIAPAMAEPPPPPDLTGSLPGPQFGADGKLQGEHIQLLPSELPGAAPEPRPSPPEADLGRDSASVTPSDGTVPEAQPPVGGHPGIWFPPVPAETEQTGSPVERPVETEPASVAEPVPATDEPVGQGGVADAPPGAEPAAAVPATAVAPDPRAPAALPVPQTRSGHVPVPEKTLTIRSLEELKVLKDELDNARRRSGGQ